MEDYEALAARVRAWLAGGVPPRCIAKHLGISEREVREFKRMKPQYEPDAETIAAECAKIRATWDDRTWQAAASLIR